MFEGLLHVGDDGFGGGSCLDGGGDEADVVVDIGESVRSEGEYGEAGFEDSGEGFHAVGDAGDDEVGAGGADLFSVGGPTVVEDGEVAGGEGGNGFQAVFGDGAEMVEAIQRVEGDGDRGLEGGYAHRVPSEYVPREQNSE